MLSYYSLLCAGLQNETNGNTNMENDSNTRPSITYMIDTCTHCSSVDALLRSTDYDSPEVDMRLVGKVVRVYPLRRQQQRTNTPLIPSSVRFEENTPPPPPVGETESKLLILENEYNL